MALIKNQKNLPLLLGAGTLCLLYGLGLSFIENYFSKLTAVISLIGLACILVCLFKLKERAQSLSKVSQWRKYGFITFVIVLFLLLLVGINYLSHRYNLRWDLTKAKQHTLTEASAAFIKELRQEVKIIAFYVGIPPKYLEDLFKEYERISKGQIKTEVIDPIVQIGYAAQFGSIISGEERKVIVLSRNNERKDIDFTNRPLSEEQLTNAIIRVVRDKRIVYFLTGHGEYNILDEGANGVSKLAKLLIPNNVETKELMLGINREIPDDCDVLIIAGAQDSLTEEEEKIVQAYLEQGGDALFLIENTPVTTPDKPLSEEEKRKNPALNSILNHWGIDIADDIVVDLSSHISGDVGIPATRNYLSHRAIVKNLDYTFYVRPRSISILKDRRQSIKVAPLVLTASEKDSWGETDRTLQIKFDAGLDKPGPITIASVIWEPKQESELSDTRIIVFTDANFLSNAFITQYSNAKMGLNVINWLSELDYRVFIDQKEIKVERLELNSKQKRTVAVILFVMPILIATTGIMTWLRKD
ncbi:MAG: GldG family protein [Omnitrophica bacterium]|nr:GldG family protein [Candidatus Omnitrophota bacterium]